ncbi:uncharacterized protein BXZ73DRAFT_77546 [Epithele typhae]|uniref:uncharacterized protein n=1 Tax=Epithele typhae TaxID=378194 RepID=UPI0020088F4E|nr:uncharacterized protein BXZ73DRAFT_77546 [Epithele typhae]KAH9932021.1 hypothetical protein BXZ73DRAFT_77546 [Epithele typhae]
MTWPYVPLKSALGWPSRASSAPRTLPIDATLARRSASSMRWCASSMRCARGLTPAAAAGGGAAMPAAVTARAMRYLRRTRRPGESGAPRAAGPAPSARRRPSPAASSSLSDSSEGDMGGSVSSSISLSGFLPLMGETEARVSCDDEGEGPASVHSESEPESEPALLREAERRRRRGMEMWGRRKLKGSESERRSGRRAAGGLLSWSLSSALVLEAASVVWEAAVREDACEIRVSERPLGGFGRGQLHRDGVGDGLLRELAVDDIVCERARDPPALKETLANSTT